jgi:hypothetical protein
MMQSMEVSSSHLNARTRTPRGSLESSGSAIQRDRRHSSHRTGYAQVSTTDDASGTIEPWPISPTGGHDGPQCVKRVVANQSRKAKLWMGSLLCACAILLLVMTSEFGSLDTNLADSIADDSSVVVDGVGSGSSSGSSERTWSPTRSRVSHDGDKVSAVVRFD